MRKNTIHVAEVGTAFLKHFMVLLWSTTVNRTIVMTYCFITITGRFR